jgi:serine phosphatase RsbU (regulator of sigma subunit)
VPSLVATADGTAFVDAPINPVLGVLDAPYRAVELELSAGELLVLYSDGLVERSRRPIDDGLKMLGREAQLSASTPISGWAGRLGELMAGTNPHDDVTVLAVRSLG